LQRFNLFCIDFRAFLSWVRHFASKLEGGDVGPSEREMSGSARGLEKKKGDEVKKVSSPPSTCNLPSHLFALRVKFERLSPEQQQAMWELSLNQLDPKSDADILSSYNADIN
jgi:hypothetical protein